MPRVNNFQEWRCHARPLLQRKVHPDAIVWEDFAGAKSLFNADDELQELPVCNSRPTISKDFITRAETVAHHNSLDRWHRLYSLAWRLLYEDKELLKNPIDTEVRIFGDMFKAVCRDKHKMKAFVRFKSISEWVTGSDTSSLDRDINMCQANFVGRQAKLCALLPQSDMSSDSTRSSENEYFVAWFEPEHFILPLVASFFVKRFTNMRWSILTPHACAHWNGETLGMTPGVPKPPLPKDDSESLWLDYYANIFNPARVKLKMMQSEMPKKYWKNLPEAAIIKELTRSAAKQVDDMIATAGQGDSHKLLNARAVKSAQKHWRAKTV